MTPEERAEEVVDKWVDGLCDVHDVRELVANAIRQAIADETEARASSTESERKRGHTHFHDVEKFYQDEPEPAAPGVEGRGDEPATPRGDEGGEQLANDLREISNTLSNIDIACVMAPEKRMTYIVEGVHEVLLELRAWQHRFEQRATPPAATHGFVRVPRDLLERLFSYAGRITAGNLRDGESIFSDLNAVEAILYPQQHQQE